MRQADYKDFYRVIKSIASYYGRELKEGVAEIYFQGLMEFDLNIIKAAIEQHQSSSDERSSFMPMISDIKRKIEGPKKDLGFIAWSKVMGAIERYGSYHDVVFDDPAIHAAIGDVGGWVRVASAEHHDLSFIQNNFISFYNTYAVRKGFEYKNKLTGRRASDQECLDRGIQVPKPKYIGDERRAAEVEQSGLGANYKIKTMAQLQQLAAENTKPPKIAQDVPDWLVGYEGIGSK